MSPFIVFGIALSAALSWSETNFNCVARMKNQGKPQIMKLEKTTNGFTLSSPEFNKTYQISKDSDDVIFEYKNYSTNQKNYLIYSVKCPLKELNCQGDFLSEYNGQKSARTLTEQITSRSVIYLDGKKSVLEVSKGEKDFSVTFFDFETKGGSSPLQFGCQV